MKINEIEKKIVDAMGATDKLLVDNIGDGALWVIYHGYLNGIYSIREQLVKLNHGSCGAVIADWKKTDRYRSMDNRLKGIRDRSTHQGIFVASEYTDWENDIANDTAHPVRRRTISLTGNEDEQISLEDFKKSIIECLESFLTEVRWIKEKAGVKDEGQDFTLF